MEAEEEFGFVFTQGYTGWEAMRRRRRGGTKIPPVGMHGHGLEALQAKRSIWNFVKMVAAPYWQRKMIRIADVNLSLGGGMNDILIEAGANSEAIVHACNGIDESWLSIDVAENEKTGGLKFLFVGRYEERKGVKELNDAIRQLSQEWPSDTEIHFVGPIPDEMRISEPCAIYHGRITDEAAIKEIYATCDVLVSPSYSEGVPTVILEAMACGMAVIATDVGGVSLLVNHDVGALIAPRNVGQLVTTMRQAISSGWVPKKKAARQHVASFAWPLVAARFINELSSFLHCSKTGRE